jgi:ubiquinol-cytochrome c reductase iron-sulfur subunit
MDSPTWICSVLGHVEIYARDLEECLPLGLFGVMVAFCAPKGIQVSFHYNRESIRVFIVAFSVCRVRPDTFLPPSSSRPAASFRSLSSKSPELWELGSVDHGYEEDRIDKVAEPERRAFTYLLLSTVRFAYASTARVLVVKFVSSMSASADVLAMASAEFDLSEIEQGKTITVKWRGKPVFIRHRTPAEVDEEAQVPMTHLRDQETDEERTLKPEWLVVLGICTHLGCVPINNAGDYHGWFCPCHGSHYDVSGRIRKGPAPLNLEIPPYKFIEEQKILIG